MHLKLKTFPGSDLCQKSAPSDHLLLRFMATTGLVVLLFVAWVLTTPVLQMSDALIRHLKTKK